MGCSQWISAIFSFKGLVTELYMHEHAELCHIKLLMMHGCLEVLYSVQRMLIMFTAYFQSIWSIS